MDRKQFNDNDEIWMRMPGSWPEKDVESKKINYNSKTNMTEAKETTNNNVKKFILEWESAELKQNNTYEKFKIVAGEGGGNLLFYSTFFADDIKFKKGDIYCLSTPGNFVKDGDIVQKVDGEEHEFRKITPSLLIKEFWEESRKTAEKLNLSEEDLNKKKESVDKLIQELAGTKKELSDLQINFNEIKTEKEKIENERMTPERQRSLLREQEILKKELEDEKNKKQDLINQLEEIQEQSWRENIQERLKEEKNKLSQLKISISDKLEIDQKVVLETLLVIQEQFDNLIFEGVDQRICSPMKNQLQSTKEKLVDKNEKLSEEEVEVLCKTRTEIIKLEFQQKQWDKLEKLQEQEQQFKGYFETK
jgi:hypothetical protein